MTSRTKLDANPALLCVFHALHSTLFPLAVITLFYKRDLGMSVTTIFVVQAFFGLVVALLEFPSGYVADRFGYRRTLVFASCLITVGWGAYAAADTVIGVFLAEGLLGVGFSFLSGADSALLYESLLARGKENEFRAWFGRMRFFGQLAEGTSAIAAGVLYASWSRLPFVLEACVALAAVFVATRLVEARAVQAPVENHAVRVKQIVLYTLRDNPRLRALLFVSVSFGLASFIPVWLIQLYATDAGAPVTWLGPLWAVANYSVALGSLLSDRFGRRFGVLPVLLGVVALVAVSYAGLGSSHALFGFAFYFLLTFGRGLSAPLLQHEEQSLIPSADRASLVSFRSLVFRVTFLAIGPLVGAGVDRHGHHSLFLFCGFGVVVLLLVGLSRFLRSYRGRSVERILGRSGG